MCVLAFLLPWAALPEAAHAYPAPDDPREYAPLAARQPPHFQKGACPFKVPAGMAVTCGTLAVPEDRGRAGGPTIKLAVAVFRTGGARPAPDPVVYLSGGPGSAALESGPRLARAWAPFLQGRDFVVFDQRGTGFSRPSLTCTESDQISDEQLNKAAGIPERLRATTAALLRCRDRLARAGVTTANYTSAASAADLDDLRAALGYRQWNILGISYGTRLALTAMRDHPDGIRSVILDSVYPPQVNLFTGMPPDAARAFDMLFTGCAASPRCNRACPNLAAQFDELADRLDTRPVTLAVRNPRGGAAIKVRFDRARLVGLLFNSLYRSDLIPLLPRMIATARAGNYALLTELESQRLSRKLGFSAGMYFSVECNEEIPFTTARDLTAAVDSQPRLRAYFEASLDTTPEIFAFCRAWGARQPDPRENEPVRSAIPTLILSGAYDPITPPAWAYLTARTLSASRVYEFPGSGHAVLSRGACPMGMIRAFLGNPAAALNSACVAALGQPAFR